MFANTKNLVLTLILNRQTGLRRNLTSPSAGGVRTCIIRDLCSTGQKWLGQVTSVGRQWTITVCPISTLRRREAWEDEWWHTADISVSIESRITNQRTTWIIYSYTDRSVTRRRPVYIQLFDTWTPAKFINNIDRMPQSSLIGSRGATAQEWINEWSWLLQLIGVLIAVQWTINRA